MKMLCSAYIYFSVSLGMFIPIMPRRHKGAKPRKSYQRRVDLAAYQRLMRFLRCMSPELNPTDVLRMLPESEKWKSEQMARYVVDLARAIEESGKSLAALVPWAVIGKWQGPTKSRVIAGHTAYYQDDTDRGRIPMVRSPGLPYVWLMQKTPLQGLEYEEAVLLDGQFPTVEGLCHLATNLRDILEDLCDTDVSRIRQRWGEHVPIVLDFFNNGEVRAVCRLMPRIEGRITPRIRVVSRHDEGMPRSTWHIEEHPQGYDFAAYCAWKMVQMIRDGHAWRVTKCTQCQSWFLRVRRDPANRHARFCSDECRRAWHNPRRGKVPKQGTHGREAYLATASSRSKDRAPDWKESVDNRNRYHAGPQKGRTYPVIVQVDAQGENGQCQKGVGRGRRGKP